MTRALEEAETIVRACYGIEAIRDEPAPSAWGWPAPPPPPPPPDWKAARWGAIACLGAWAIALLALYVMSRWWLR